LTETVNSDFLSPVLHDVLEVEGGVEPSTKERLVLTAERLFALHGVDGVSLRHIGAESAMGNNSVVQYHFGSKEGLIDAILVSRLKDLTERRRVLFAQVSSDTIRSIAEAQLLPVMELAERKDCHYLMFLEQLQRHGTIRHALERLTDKWSQDPYVTRLSRVLSHVPPRLRTTRVNQASAICLHTCADRQRARHFGSQVVPYVLHVNQLLDGIEAFLSAPPSRHTLHALKNSTGYLPSLRALP
jgi:AcrR family transcriptional regulator